ncbi:hypothetical protein EMGBS15_01450 [Filimonas sp.]|nr:hypothetical protein EMGBS15_01450 [Filimonas sp.]
MSAIFFCSHLSISAQQAASSAGGNAAGSGGSFSYTIGEPVSSNISDIGGIIHEGVQQSVNIQLRAKVFLSGPFDLSTGWMKDSLRANYLIPLTEPYSSLPYSKAVLTESAGETFSNALLNESTQNALVDWLFIEIRSASNPSSIVATKRALLQRDGDVVSHADGVSPVQFDRVPAGNYYVSIKTPESSWRNDRHLCFFITRKQPPARFYHNADCVHRHYYCKYTPKSGRRQVYAMVG